MTNLHRWTLAAAWCLCWPLAVRGAESSKPNVVVILLDNIGQEWFGCYGSEEGCTPNIDRLAATGVRAEHCYSFPVCGPSRIQLLTGRYPHSHGFRLHHDAALYSGGGLDPRREVLFPRLFRDAGYATGIAGKWQVNNLYDEPAVLKEHGFEEQLVWPGSIDRDRVPPAEMAKFRDAVRREAYDELVVFNQQIESRYWDPVLIRDGKRAVEKEKFGPDLCQEFALDFLRRHQAEPFLLYLPMFLAHGQTFSQPAVPTPANRNANRPELEMFRDMLRYADGLVAQIVEELERLGVRDNTYVVVASDNGTEPHFQARANGRVVHGALYQLTEAGSEVALLFNSPKRIPGGRTAPLADFTDIYPTLCELAGVPLAVNHKPEGESLAKYLRGEAGAKPTREWMLNEYHRTRVVCDGQYKLYSDGRLFDVVHDPGETRDLAGSSDAAVVAGREKLQQVLASLPPDAPSPFLLRSLSGFKLREAERQGREP